MSDSDKLRMDNHALYRRVQHLVRLQWKWEAIALEVGVYSIKDLCHWVLAYREPKKLPMVNARYVANVPVKSRLPSNKAEQFIAWRKERNGARQALEGLQ